MHGALPVTKRDDDSLPKGRSMKTMSTRVLVTVLAALAVTSTAVTTGGCGQDVASCATVCALPDAEPTSCMTSCTSVELQCATAGDGADLQLLLTCLSNAGLYSAIGGSCASEAKTVASACGQALGTGTGTGTGTGSGSTGFDGGQCAVLADCCGTLGQTEAAECNQVADQNDPTSCEALFSELVGAGECPGSVPPGTGG